jgi:hypothetical protein
MRIWVYQVPQTYYLGIIRRTERSTSQAHMARTPRQQFDATVQTPVIMESQIPIAARPAIMAV